MSLFLLIYFVIGYLWWLKLAQAPRTPMSDRKFAGVVALMLPVVLWVWPLSMTAHWVFRDHD